jgi:DNA-binding CsgD family transcriptional regulator
MLTSQRSVRLRPPTSSDVAFSSCAPSASRVPVSGRAAGPDPTHALDVLGDGVAIFGDGGLLMTNAELRRLFAGAGGEGVREEVERLADAVTDASRTPSGGGVGALLEAEVRTPTGTVRLAASEIPAAPSSAGARVLVVARRMPESGPVERFGLSRQEFRVARLLAQGLSNDEVASRLFISTHTARHHTQRVLSKLDVRSRAAVAAKLLLD